MQSDPAREWQRLTRLYGEMSDEELRNLAATFSDLTEFAQPILRDEMRKRGLGNPEARPSSVEENHPAFGWRNWAPAEHNAHADASMHPGTDSEEEAPHEYTWKTLLCECDEREQAWQVAEALRRAGIESWIEAPGPSYEIGLPHPRVIVAADQLDEAKQILAQPIPQDIVDQSKVKMEDFVPPACPKCGTDDPLLESVDTANTWRCENCGAQWKDSATFDPARAADD